MTDEERRRVRTRDDRELRAMLVEVGERLHEAGRESHPLDWEAVIRDERAAAHWRARLRVALGGLGAEASEPAAGLAQALGRLARAPETLAAAALEVMMTTAREAPGLDLARALGCLPPGAEPRFAYEATGPLATRGVRVRGPGPPNPARAGVLTAAALEAQGGGARVTADAARGTVSVQFRRLETPVLVLLVPQAADQAVRLAPAGPEAVQVTFQDVGPGPYLVAVYLAA